MITGTRKFEVGEVKADGELDRLTEHVINNHKYDGDAITHHYKVRRQEELSVTVMDDMVHKDNAEEKDTVNKKRSCWCSCFGK